MQLGSGYVWGLLIGAEKVEREEEYWADFGVASGLSGDHFGGLAQELSETFQPDWWSFKEADTLLGVCFCGLALLLNAQPAVFPPPAR